MRPWDDPHNADPAYTRARVRHEALPALETALGPGVARRSPARRGQFRDDAEALDEWAAGQVTLLRDSGTGALDVALRPLPPAVRRRVIRSAAVGAGCPRHALRPARRCDRRAGDRLAGQRWANLPGGVGALTNVAD